MTDRQLDLLRHACGIGSRDPYYRDYFAAEPDGDDDREWTRMVTLGLAEVRWQPAPCWSPLRIYGVTDEGKRAIGAGIQPGARREGG